MNRLEVNDLQADVGGKKILSGLNLIVESGQIHVVMGRNGSGKSTLVNALIGRPGVSISGGDILVNGCSIKEEPVEERALAGLFVAAQYPVEVPGLSNGHFLRSMANLRKAGDQRPLTGAAAFLAEAKKCCGDLGIPEDFLQRSLNSGMSGGEKKRNELLQLHFSCAKFAVLDEIDSGLDVDAWNRAMDFIEKEAASKNLGLILISHYSKMVSRFSSAIVHVIDKGKIVKSGGAELAQVIEQRGFDEALS